MKKYLSCLSILLLLVNFSAFAEDAAEEEFLTGQELLSSCEENASPGNPSQFCMQYVFGFVQNIEMLHQAEPNQPRLFCIDPQAVGLPEVTEKMKNWLASKSDRLGQEAYILVGQALAANYPCSDSKPF